MSYCPACPDVQLNGRSDLPSNIDENATEVTEAGTVNVQFGEEEINRLTRHLSALSARSVKEIEIESQHDLEKGEGAGAAHFGQHHHLEASLREARQNQRLIGEKRTRIPVCFRNLSVDVASENKTVGVFPLIPDIYGLMKKIHQMFMSTSTNNGDSKHTRRILKDLNGIAKPGELVLVLGRPGSGCTTLLKLLSNHRDNSFKITGEVTYGDLASKEFKQRFPNEAVYCSPDDVHLASLTVQQTLDFAVKSKAPDSHLPDQSLKEYKSVVVTALLKMFNLSHVRDTMVGNAYIRGISGGQRKRVSIAEMMISGATVCCWDNSTLGLDAVSASDYIRSLRILTNYYQSTTFVSLYQGSDVIADNFDQVLLLEDGHQIYYGPLSSAQSYFESLGFRRKEGQSLPDFLTESVDQRQKRHSNLHNADVKFLALQYKMSEISKKVESDMELYVEAVRSPARTAPQSEKSYDRSWIASLRQKSYSSTFWQQTALTFGRHVTLKLQDRFSLIVQTCTSVIVAILCGSIYFQLPRTSEGAFTRGGVVFIALLYNAFTAFAELPTTMFGRPVLLKHKAFGFHRPSALYIGQILFDIPMAAAQILIFSIIVYFMAGLYLTASGFFTFYVLLVMSQAVMTVFFRTLGCLMKTFDGAIRIACICVILFVLTSGYLVPIQDMSGVVGWFYWLNPVAYGFSAMLMNEFKALNLTCTRRNLVPSGPGYQNIEHQTCTLPGSVSGTDLVNGADYLRLSFDYDVKNLGRNAGILVLFFTGLLVLNVVVGELTSFSNSSSSEKTYLNKSSMASTVGQPNPGSTTSSAFEDAPQSTHANKFTWSLLNYTVTVPKGELQLLHNISGYVESGCLLALMGASGAGKSTLLDVLCARKTIGTIQGNILVNGRAMNEGFRSQAGYCEQLDIHESSQTVREALRFSAHLRRPQSVPRAEKDAYVEELIVLLEMEEFADALIGASESGLSIEERKRLTIGVELAAKPEILLFLDEPTSGLDTQSAINIVRILRRLADNGKAIICTIHQPNATIFSVFDKLLLLSEGKTIYFGPTNMLQSYLGRHDAICPQKENIAEFMLRVLDNEDTAFEGAQKWNAYWEKSEECVEMNRTIQSLNDSSSSLPAPKLSEESQSSFMYQLKLVSYRAMTSLWRTPEYGNTRLVNHITVGLLTGLAYLNIGNSRSDLQYRVFVIFQLTVLPSMILSQIQPRYEIARTIYSRERSCNMYGQMVFLSSVVIAELPQVLICSVVYFACFYFPTKFSVLPTKAGFQFLMVVITELFSVFLGLAVAALTPSAYMASLFTPFLLVTFSLFCGVTVPPPQIPTFWRVWLYRINPFTYLVGGMMETEFSGIRVRCSLEEFQTFIPPTNQTCLEYAQEFLLNAPGYLRNPTETMSCGYCPFSNGDEFIDQFGLLATDRWRDLGIFAAFCVSTFIIYIVAGRSINWSKR